jgi:hypothetical protein
MNNLLQNLNNLDLTCDECKELEQKIKRILRRKIVSNTCHWLKQQYHINESFVCLDTCFAINHTQYNNRHMQFYFNSSNDEEDYNTFFVITFNNNDRIMDVRYETDRYTQYTYSQDAIYPNGEMQGKDITTIYTDPKELTRIQRDIEEIKILCTYLI